MIIGQNDKSPNIFQKIFNLNVKFDYFLRDDSNYLIIGNERNGVAATGIIPIIKTSLFKKILVTEELNLNQIKSSIKDKKTIIFHLSEFDFNKNLINSPSCLSNFINFFNITEEDLIDSDVINLVPSDSPVLVLKVILSCIACANSVEFIFFANSLQAINNNKIVVILCCPSTTLMKNPDAEHRGITW